MGKQRKYTPDEDASQVEELRSGRTGSFESLVWKYQKRLFNIVFMITGDYECAVASVQSAFVTAYFNAGSLRSTSHFYAWLAGLAIRESRSLLELKQQLAADMDLADNLPQEKSWIVSSSDTSSIKHIPTELQERLRNCIKTLPASLAEVLVLKHVRGYDGDRVAEILQLREETICGQLFEAQEKVLFCIRHQSAFPATGARSEWFHPEIREKFSEFLDNSLDENGKSALKGHLLGCGNCREALAELEWILEHLKSLPDIEPPSRLMQNIMLSIRSGTVPQKKKRHGKRKHLKRRIAYGFAAALFLGILLWIFTRKDEQQTSLASSITEGARRTLSILPQQKQASQPLPAAGRLPHPDKGVPAKPASMPANQVQQSQQPPAVPLPPAAVPTIPLAQPPRPSLPQASLPANTERSAASGVVKRGRQEPVQLPAEWGENQPQGIFTQARPPVQKGRGGEMSIVLRTTDPDSAAREIESAVTALGGNITGRAYSGGSDILYARVDVLNVMELVIRLEKIGKMLDLPHIPDVSEGNVDLVIRW